MSKIPKIKTILGWVLALAVLIMTYMLPTSVLEVRAAEGQYEKLQDFDGKRIGVQTGTTFGTDISQVLPNAKIMYFSGVSDMVAALESHKIDAFALINFSAMGLCSQNDKITYIDEYFTEFDRGYGFAKTAEGEKYRDQFNEFIEKIRADGTLKELEDKWMNGDSDLVEMEDYSQYPATNGMIRVMADATFPPVGFIRDGRAVGFDIELAALFCKEYGYGLEVQNAPFDSILAALRSGKCVYGASGVTITPERAETINFSDPVLVSGGVLLTLKDNVVAQDGLYETAQDLDGKKIGIQTGTNFGDSVIEELSKADLNYYTAATDMIAALKSHKVEALAIDDIAARAICRENKDLTILTGDFEKYDTAFGFAKNEKGQKLRDEFSEYLQETKADGSFDELKDKWLDHDPGAIAMEDYEALPDINGTVNAVTDATYPPVEYIQNGRVIGLDIELIGDFCKRKGYALKLSNLSFDAVLPAVATGKMDVAACSMGTTAERSESVLFSEPTITTGCVIVVLKSQTSSAVDESIGGDGGNGIRAGLDSLAGSFEKTFIRESRWKLFMRGIGKTLLITFLSIITGTMLGFALFMLCRNGNKLANVITNVSVWVITGMPMVVLLMVICYIVFAKVNIDGVLISWLAFTLTFGASVLGMLRLGVASIDRGQYEAAYALGHSNLQTFFRVILPQAIPLVMNTYKGEITGLIKATAIVGYIAVEDLTKMGDIVRSRTYEAFFPLIAITIIYFVLEALLNLIVGIIQRKLDPRRRKPEDILKDCQ